MTALPQPIYAHTDRQPFAEYVASRYPSPEAILMDFLDDLQVAAASIEASIGGEPLILDGAPHYLPNAQGQRNQKQGYFAEFRSGGDGVVMPVIRIRSFKQGGQTVTWNPRDLVWQEWQAERQAGNVTIAPADRVLEYEQRASELKAAADAKRAALEAEAELGRQAAADAAKTAWGAATEATDHPYLDAKGVQPYGLRVAAQTHKARLWSRQAGEWQDATFCRAGDLLIPLYHEGQLVNLQRIDQQGNKRFIMGAQKKGASFSIGATGSPGWIAEGYATAATLHEVTGQPVVVAFDAGNLPVVAAQFPDQVSKVAADNDDAGIKAAEAAGLPHIAPPVVGMDWNDYANEKGRDAALMLLQQSPSLPAEPEPDAYVMDAASDLASEIEHRLASRLQIEDPQSIQQLGISAANIRKWINGAFWSGSSSKLFLLNSNGDLVRFVEKDAAKYLEKTHGAIQNSRNIDGLARDAAIGTPPQVEKFVEQAKALAGNAVLEYVKYYNQRDSVEWRVDMFAKDSRVELIEDKARIVLTHKPFRSDKAARAIDGGVVEDYKAHFPRFDETLEFIVASRFASDRKKAYLWIKADSDWGKGFFNGLLTEIGASAELSVKEVEKMFDGSPVGRPPEEFKRSFALVFNEFKTVKSELKQLESGLALSPKHQLVSRVEVFAKLFFSAESVGSLVTEHGVEDQFANRFSLFEEHGSIEDRDPFRAKGKAYYFSHVLAYAIQRLNALVAERQALGEARAAAEADAFLDGFIGRYGISTLYQRYSESLPDIAAEAVEWVKKHANDDPKMPTIVKDMGTCYLKSANKAIDLFLDANYDPSTVPSLRKKKDEIARLMSADGKGIVTHHPPKPQRPFKAIKLKE